MSASTCVPKRRRKYLSYSALKKFEADPAEFYLTYMTPTRPPWEPQGQPAAAGSAFDAYAKYHLMMDLFGKVEPQYELRTLFESQVDKQHWDWAWENGKYIFECYQISGSYKAFLELCQQAVEPPQFEFTVEANVGGVPILGKPDGYLKLDQCRYILDWKVNGYCSKTGKSPQQGYVICRDGWRSDRQSRSHNTSHPKHVDYEFCGQTISKWALEDFESAWAAQTAMYAWALGECVGDETFIAGIDQVVAKQREDAKPLLRFASLRGRIRKEFQEHLLNRLKVCWEIVSSEHIFRDLSFEESEEKCAMLNRKAEQLYVQADNPVMALIRKPYWG